MTDRFAKRQKTASLKEQRQVTIGRIIFVLCLMSFVLCPAKAKAKANADSIYNGTMIKLDIASPVITAASHKWKMQHYELAVNVRLAKRFYPTFELGYAGGSTTQGDSIQYNGQGGFFRVGCDINPLKKHPESPHALLVGVRLGTAVQGARQGEPDTPQPFRTKADCWGEIVAGCQVEIVQVNNTSFYMGWMARFKCLFTRQDGLTVADMNPVFIPGYGKRDIVSWGASYHLGWRF